MRIYHHPASTAQAPNWAIWSKTLVPNTLVSSLSDVSKPFFLTKDVGSGILVDSEVANWAAAESRYIALCNASAADSYLGGSGRADVISLNIITHRITNNLVVAR